MAFAVFSRTNEAPTISEAMTKLNRWHGNFDLKIFKIKQGRTSFALVWLMLEFQLKPVTGGASRLSCLGFT